MTIKTKARPHQKKAIAKVVKEFTKAKRTQVNMACGTGKTLVGIAVADKVLGKRNIIFAPTIGLVYQMLRSYGSEVAMDRTMIVCSDDSEAREAKEKYNIKSVTTDPETIGAEIRKRGGNLFVFCTYRSGERIAEAYRLAKTPAFDFAVMDEAHRLAGKDSEQKCVLFDDQVPIRKRLFMTATPRITKDSAKKNRDGIEVFCMNDSSLFGDVVYHYPFSQAIKEKQLSDYQLVIIKVTEDDVLRKLREDEDMEFAAKHAGIVKAMHTYNLRKGIAFYSKNSRAALGAECIGAMHERLKSVHQASGNLWLRQLSGEDNIKVREAGLLEMAAKGKRHRCLITNSKIFGEGMDSQTLDFIVIADPIQSEVDVVQAVGRAIRKHPDKDIATIIVPVFISKKDDGLSGEELMSRTGPFRAAWGVLSAMRDQDDRIEMLINPSGRPDGVGKSTQCRLPENIIFDGLDDSVICGIGARLVKFSAGDHFSSVDDLLQAVKSFGVMHGRPMRDQDTFALGTRLGSVLAWKQWTGISDLRERVREAAGRKRGRGDLPNNSPTKECPICGRDKESREYCPSDYKRNGKCRSCRKSKRTILGLGRVCARCKNRCETVAATGNAKCHRCDVEVQDAKEKRAVAAERARVAAEAAKEVAAREAERKRIEVLRKKESRRKQKTSEWIARADSIKRHPDASKSHVKYANAVLGAYGDLHVAGERAGLVGGKVSCDRRMRNEILKAVAKLGIDLKRLNGQHAR